MGMPAGSMLSAQVISSMPWCCYFALRRPGGILVVLGSCASPLRLAEFSGRGAGTSPRRPLPRVRAGTSVLQAAGSAQFLGCSTTRLAGPLAAWGPRRG